ncbi:MAG: Kelch repeat-containing protein, partial [Planctomycetota bacterium]
PNDRPATALDLGPLAPTTVAGTIDRVAPGPVAAGDLDTFRFVATVDGMFVARLELPSGADYDLALFDAEGRRIATSRADNTDPDVGPVERLRFPVSATAAYYVEVGGYAGDTGGYRLALEILADPLPGPPDPATAGTTLVGPLVEPRSFHAAAALPDGRVLVAGGTSDPSSQVNAVLNAIASTEWFDPVTARSSPGPDLGAGRFGLTATVLPTGRVLLAGGDLAGSADLFDPFVGEGLVARNIPMTGGVRVLPTATLLADGRVLLAGGTTIRFAPLPTAQTLDSTTIFDPKTRTFAAGPGLLAPRASHAAVRLADGRVLLTGGVGRADSEVVSADATVSDPGPGLSGVRDDHSATRLADGRVLLAGGQDAAGRSLDTAEILETIAGGFRLLAATMLNRRADHQALRLPTGQVLVLGGEDDPGGGADVILVGVDLFDPATETFVAMPPVAVPRDDHRVVRLADGRILVTGGEDAASVSIAAVEIYSPR